MLWIKTVNHGVGTRRAILRMERGKCNVIETRRGDRNVVAMHMKV